MFTKKHIWLQISLHNFISTYSQTHSLDFQRSISILICPHENLDICILLNDTVFIVQKTELNLSIIFNPLQHAQTNEIFNIAAGTDELPAHRCVKYDSSSETDSCDQFYICPPLINSTDHLCDIINEPIERWVTDFDIAKISCDGRTQGSSTWKNVSTVQACDSDWHDSILSNKNKCNFSGNITSFITTSSKLFEPSVFQGLLWLFGLLAVLGNLFVIIFTYRLLMKTRNSLSKVQKIHHILSINLAVADFLMGIYLIILAIYSRFNYNPTGLTLHISGSLCNFLGVINLVSSQMSVSILVIITSFRLYSSLKPFKSPNLASAAAMACFAWIFWFVVACIPFLNMVKLQNVFVQYVDHSCSNRISIFRHITVQDFFEKFEQQARSVCKLPSSNLYQLRHTTVENQLSVLQHLKLINGTPIVQSFYEQQPLCTTKYLFSSVDDAKYFGLPLLGFNFTAFIYIFVAYIMICFKTLKRRRLLLLCCSGSNENGNQNARNKEDMYLQLRVFLIVATDFLCWIPTSVVAFWYMLSAHNPQIPEICEFMLSVLVPLGSFIMVLLPINSALNPLLYTSATRAAIKTWFGSCKRSKKKSQNQIDAPHNPKLCSSHPIPSST